MLYQPRYDFFLGALSPGGFHGWFQEILQESPMQAYLIKAGPGCGKSTFMRRLAADDSTADTAVERIHCSSDPESLDGVRLAGYNTLVLDATAPHTVDCVYPDAAERVLSFYDTLDHSSLQNDRGQILALGQRNTALLRQAAGHYAIACSLLAHRRKTAETAVDHFLLQAFAARLARRTMPPRKTAKPGIQRHRLLSAPTPGAPTVFYDTIPQLASKQLYAIEDSYGAVSALLLAALAAHARANGYDAYLCHCPTAPDKKLDHLFIPELGLGFVTANSAHPMLFAHRKVIRARRFTDAEKLSSHKAVLAWQKHLAKELIHWTCTLQSEAKAVHDQLEKYYVAATDFSAVDALCARTAQEIFAK